MVSNCFVREDLVAMSITIFGCALGRCGAQFPRPRGTKVLARLAACIGLNNGSIFSNYWRLYNRLQVVLEAPNEIKSVCY